MKVGLVDKSVSEIRWRRSPSLKALRTARAIQADPSLLVSAIGYHRCGHPRAHLRSPDLEREIETSAIIVSDFAAEIRLEPPADEVAVLRSVARQTEGEPHWQLKRCAWLLAAAMLPSGELRPEALIDPDRRKKRADLISIDEARVRSLVFEVGAVSCDSILVALDAGHHQVIALPHQPDDACPVAGYVFARAERDPLPPPSAQAIRKVQSVLRGRLNSLTTASPLAPADIGLASWLDKDVMASSDLPSTHAKELEDVHPR